MRMKSQKLATRDLTRSHPSPPHLSHLRLDWLTSIASPTGNSLVPNSSSNANAPAAGTQKARTKASARGQNQCCPALACLDVMVDFFVWHTLGCHLHLLGRWYCYAVDKLLYFWFCKCQPKYKMCIFYITCDHFLKNTVHFWIDFISVHVSLMFTRLMLAWDQSPIIGLVFKIFPCWFIQMLVGNPSISDLRITIEL